MRYLPIAGVTLGVLLAAQGTAAAAPAAPQQPTEMRIDADRMTYEDLTGTVTATGAVDVHYGTSRWQAEELRGNYREKRYYLPQVRWTDEARTLALDLEELHYRADTDEAHFRQAAGRMDRVYILRAEDGIYDHGKGESRLSQAALTTPSAVAKVPDYRLEARNIVVRPGEEAVAEDVDFYIKNTRILHLSRYKTSLRQDGNGGGIMSFIPRPAYRHHDGFGLKARWRYPLGSQAEAFLNYAWYAKSGFKPDVGFRYYLPWGEMVLHYAKESSQVNDNGGWLEKRPEFILRTKRFYFGAQPVYARGEMSFGTWHEGDVRGSHRSYNASLETDPLPLGRHWQLRPYIGYRQDRYGYTETQRNDFYYGARATYEAGRFTWWTGADIHRLHGETPYRFDRYDIARSALAGVKYQVDRLNGIGVEYTWDLENGSLRHIDYTWYRDMHSFAGTVTYRAKDREWRVDIWAKDF